MQSGFTLIELMVVVAILSILASLAVGAFNGYVRRSKTAEATGNLSQLYKSVTAYYDAERTGKGLDSSTVGHCTVASEPLTPSVPGMNKQPFTGSAGFSAIGFSIADFVYFGYGLTSSGAQCGWQANTPNVYTLFANGNLDGDASMSTYEMAVGSDNENSLYHARGFYIVNETD